MSLLPDQSAVFEIAGLGKRFDQARIVIAPTAPVTTMEIDYEIKFNE